MTRADEPWITPRPEGDRFTGGGHYHRPQWGLWRLWFPADLLHAAQAAALTGVATAATAVLAGLRVWQRINTTDDETGD